MKNLAFLKSPGTVSQVNGVDVTFYMVSPAAVFEIRGLSTPLASAIATLFSNTKDDTGRVIKRFESTRQQERTEVTELNAIGVDMAVFRSKQKEEAISKLIDALTSQDHYRTVIKIVMDCMRDDFDRPLKESDVTEFGKSVDLGTLVQLLKGVVKANMEVFGPLEARVTELMKSQMTSQPPSPDSTQPSPTTSNAESPALRLVGDLPSNPMAASQTPIS
jgi:hypothetical protein